jgi:hypothetical protein
MVQIPQYQAQQGLDVPPTPSINVDDSIGRGLQQAGSAITAYADRVAERTRQKEAFGLQTQSELLNEQLNQQLIEAQRNGTADGSGLHDDFVAKNLTPKTDEFLSQIKDPELKEKWSQKMKVFRETWANNAANKEYEIGNSFSKGKVNEMWSARASGLTQDPGAVDSYLKEMDEVIDQAPNLTTAERLEMKQKMRKDAPVLVAEALKTQDPETYFFAAGKGTEDERQAFITRRLVPAVQAAENVGKDPRAVSGAGAIGMMQVMLPAAEDVAKEIGDKAFLEMTAAQRTEYLMNPDTNMKYGTIYLGMMVKRYKGDAEAALIAYNAGMKNADKWLASGRDYASLPKREETEPYVQKVIGNLGAAKLAVGAATGKASAGARIPIQTGTQAGRQPLDMSNMNETLVDRWEQVQGAFGKAVPVVSANRDAARNEKAGGAKGSQHLHGNAIDVDVSRMSKAERMRLIETASSMGFTGIGVYANSLHFDMRAGPRAMWGPSHHGDSVPAQYQAVRAKHMRGAPGIVVAGGKTTVQTRSLAQGQAGPGIVQADTRSGFVAPVFQSMPANELIRVQNEAETLRAKADKDAMAQSAADAVVQSMGDDPESAYKMLEQINDADVRKDATTLVDQHFARQERIQTQKDKELYEGNYANVYNLIQAGKPEEALKSISHLLPPTKQAELRKMVTEGPVTIDDDRTKDELDGLWMTDPKAFAEKDLTPYFGKLTNATLAAMKGRQEKIQQELQSGTASSATSIRSTINAASGLIDNKLKEIGVKLSADASPSDISYANRIRSMATKELEKLQIKLGRPPLDTEIEEVVKPIFKKTVRKGWVWNDDVTMESVLKDYDDAGVDINTVHQEMMAVRDKRAANGLPTSDFDPTPENLSRALTYYKKKGQQ